MLLNSATRPSKPQGLDQALQWYVDALQELRKMRGQGVAAARRGVEPDGF